MSRERVERLRRNVEGLWKKDLAADVLASIDPAVSIYPPPQWPDQSVYRGPEGAKKLASEWTENFDDYRIVVDRVIDGEDYLVGLLHHEGRTKGQGVFISERPGIVTDEYVGDVPRRARYYLSWEEALEAAGLGRAAADDREINASPAASA